jgi:hypothetical protein
VKGATVADPLFTLPFAVLPDGADPAAFYSTFTGNLTATADGDAVSVWVAEDGDLATVHAPLKAAMRFAPSGSVLDTSTAATDTLVLQTWPLSYTDLQPVLGSAVPAQVLIGNVDQAGVRDAVRDLYVAIGKPETSVDAFMTGDGLLLVPVGTPVGTAAPGTAPPDPAMPNNARITATDAASDPVNVTQFFADGAALAGIDATLHPLLAAIPLEGWIDVVVLDETGGPLAAEAYDLYLSDGTTRSGTTDADGRIAETGLPPGEWALDLPGQPSFAFVDTGG